MRDDTAVSNAHLLDEVAFALDNRSDLAYFQVFSAKSEVLNESGEKPGISELPGNANLAQAFRNGESLQLFAADDYEAIQAIVISGKLVGFTRFGFNAGFLRAEIRQIVIEAIAFTAIIAGLGA